VKVLAFSTDGKMIAVGSAEDRAGRIIATSNGQELARITHEGAITAAAFSPDGTALATAADSNDRSARLWTLKLDYLNKTLCAGPGRNPTLMEWKRYLGNAPWQPTCETWPIPDDITSEGLRPESR
jgi:WD40 repeat protein